MPGSNQKRTDGAGITPSTSSAETVAVPEDHALAIMGLACNMPLSKPTALPNVEPSVPHDHSESTFSPPPPRLWFEAHSQFSRQVASYLWYGPAPDWWSINRVGQKSFIDFVRRDPAYLNEDNSVFPATKRAVIEWIAHLGALNVRSETLKSYLIDVRALHIDAGYPTTVFESPVVQCLIRGIK
ncbi:hypothetical protein GSI_04358 [Ganoderma sinense ZZ0214-1]|uniref:Uncharacterized protein n=1 Tax=Ganoderma sinense ZZ0214-1 TaxID=1077348 RepID=A0A2G8SIY2_9APHY|nr:hypothetical protein GSI_04358 [Ganoderma sinense ZZ0214-1]